ncbi:MAG: tandem-95 repeat protein [Magnetococcales bacterium]|nr:tandem-95 repeat protein [Magnetococcales bacterium]
MSNSMIKTQKNRSALASVAWQDAMMMALEPRVLFDGALATTAKDLLHEQGFDDIVANKDVIRDAIDKTWHPVLDQLANPHHSLMIVDTTVTGWRQLVAAVAPGVEVVLLDKGGDGVARVSELLAGRSQIQSLYLVSHGRAGDIILGDAHLTLDTLESHAATLSSWGSALAPGGSILVYGCDVGQGSQGEAFVQALSRVTGAAVAASSDATGAAQLGGDWDLEVHQGNVDTTTPFVPTVLQSFDGLLATPINMLPTFYSASSWPPVAVPAVVDHGITLNGGWINIKDNQQALTPINTTQGTISVRFMIDQNAHPLNTVGFIFDNDVSGHTTDLIDLHVEYKTITFGPNVGQNAWLLYGGLYNYNASSLLYSNAGVSTPVIVKAGQWHQAALTWRSDGSGDIYFDGNWLVHYNAGNITFTNAVNNKVAIGTISDLGTFIFPGSIAEVRIWNTSWASGIAGLTGGERTDLATASLTGAEAGLTAYYPLNDGVSNSASTVATDTKGGVTATLQPVGGPQWITHPQEDNTVTVSLGGGDANGTDTIAEADITSVPNPATVGSLYLSTDVTHSTPLVTGSVVVTSVANPLREVVFVPVADYNGLVSWTYNVKDTSGITSATAATVSFTMDAVNDAPVVTAAAPSMTTITEDQTTNAGQTVASFLGTSITDVDTGAVQGIAITTYTGNGTWQYNTGGGWTNVGVVSASSALLLKSTDSIRYVPDANNGETATLSYRAWDQTSGSTGTKVDVSANGGTTAFSSGSDTASLVVSSANDAPVVTAIAPALTTITEKNTTNTGQTIASFLGTSVTDVDTGASKGIAITALNTGFGTWQYNTGGAWTNIGAVSGTSALLLRSTDSIRYIPDGLHGETVGFTYQAWDQTSGAAGTKVNASVTGGTSAFSTGSDTATLTVSEVIDAPQLTIGTGNVLNFDGNNDTITNATFNFPTNAFTIEMWWKPAVNLTSANSQQDMYYCASGGSRPYIAFNKIGNGEIGIFTKTGGSNNSNAVTTTHAWTGGQWYHLAFTYDGTNVRVYVNGQLQTTAPVANPGPITAGNGFYMGTSKTLGSDMKGALADVQIWSVTQSQATIFNNMSRQLTGAEAGLVGYWPMDEGAGMTIFDHAATPHNGTITPPQGPTWSTGVDAVYGMEEQDIAIPDLSLTDVDSLGNSTINLTVVSGILTVDTSVVGGVGAAGVAGNGTANVTLTGTLAQLNATLAGTNALVYRGNVNFYGNDTLTINVTDNTGGTAAGTIAITVNNVYDPLGVTTGGTLVFTEGDAASKPCATVAIVNDDGNNLTSAKVWFTGGYVSGQDVLSFVNAGAITGSWNAGTGILSLTGADTTANYQAALRSVLYNNSGGNNPTAGSRTLSWTVTSALGTSPTSTSTVTVVPVNDQPVMTAAAATISYQEKDPSTLIDAMFTVADPDNTTLQSAKAVISNQFVAGEDRLVFVNQSGISGSWDGVNGILTLSGPATLANYQTAIRSVRYINDNLQNPQAVTKTVQVTVNDGALDSTAVQDMIAVTAVNDAPGLILPGAVTVNQDQSSALAGITVTDVDVGTGTMQLALSVNHGTVTLGSTTGLSIVSGANGSATMTVTGTMTAINSALSGLSYQSLLHYAGADSLTIVANDLGGSGSGGAKTTTSSLGITVNAVQQPPVAGDDALMTLQDHALVITITSDLLTNDVDTDGDPLMMTAFTNPANGTLVDNGNGTLTYTPNNGYFGSDSFVYTVNDGHGNTDQGVVTVVVKPLHSLQAVDDAGATLEEVPVTVSVLGNDRDPDYLPNGINPALHVIGFTAPGNGQVTHNGSGQFTYTPNVDFFGVDAFTYTLNAGDNRIAVGTVTITVSDVNDPPVMTINTGASVVEGATVTLANTSLQVTDIEQPATQLTLTLVTIPVHGTLKLNGVALGLGQTWTQDDINNNRLVYLHDGSETLADSFSFTGSDGVGGALLQNDFHLTVIPTPDNPVLVKGAVAVAEGGQVTLGTAILAATDPDSPASSLTYTVDTLPVHGGLLLNGVALGVGGQFTQADVDAGNLAYHHDGSNTVGDNFSFHIDDGQGGSLATTTLPITIALVNAPPAWTVPGAQTVDQDLDLDMTGIVLNDSDAGGGLMQVTASVSHGTIRLLSTSGLTVTSGSNGAATWTVSGTLSDLTTALAHVVYHSQANYHGADQLTLDADDGGNTGSGGAKVTVTTIAITVQAVNDFPNAGIDAFTTVQDTPVTLSLANDLMINDTDPGGSILSFMSFAQPSHGSVAQVGATLVYTPQALYTGTDSFTYTIVNAYGNTGTATVSLVVSPIYNFLTPGNDTVTVLENSAVTTSNLLANDLDPNYLPDGVNPAFTITGFTPTVSGTLTYLGAGRFTYVPNAGFYGTDSFTYTESVGDQRVATADVTITVQPVNHSPVFAVNTGLSLNEGGQVTVTDLMLQAQDTEQTAAQVHFILANTPAHGSLALNGTVLTTGGGFTQDDIDNHRVVYSHDGSETTSDPFVVTVTDGVGGFLNNQTVTVTVTPVNDLPQLTVNTGLTVLEGGSGTLSAAMLTTVDAESAAGALVYTLTSIPGHGSLRLNGTALTVGQTFTQADVNAALVTYLHDGTNTLTDGFHFTVQDVQGGSYSDTPFNISVTQVNDPLIVNAGAALNYTEGDAALFANPGLTVVDADGTNLLHAQVAIVAGFKPGEDVLHVTNTASIFGSFNATTGVLSLTGVASLADYQLALQSVTYSNAAGHNPTAGVRTLEWSGTDTLETSPVSQSTITVIPVDDAPVVVAGTTLSYLEKDAATPVSPSITVTDADSSLLQSATVTIANQHVAGEDRLVYTNQGGISGSWDATSGTLTLSGPATVAGYQTALRSVSFINDNVSNPQPSTRTVWFRVHDGQLASAVASANVVVTAVNDAPVITTPVNRTMNEDGVLIVSGVTVADVDAANGTVQFALGVNHGTITLGATTGVTFVSGTDASSTMTVTGTVAAINNALNGMTYQPTQYYSGNDTLTLVANDLGLSGNGGALTHAAAVGITINPVQHAPTANVDTILAAQNVPKMITVANDLLANDFDVDGDTLTLASFTQPTHGSLIDNGDGTLTYQANYNYFGLDSMTYTLADGHGNSGQAVVTVVVNPVFANLQANDDNVVTPEEVPVSFNVLTNDRDPGYFPNGINPQLAVIGFTDPAHGQVVASGAGQFQYTPDTLYFGTDTLTYTVSVGDNRVATGTVTITVTPVNHSPSLAVLTGAGVLEGGAVTISSAMLQVTDPEQSASQVTLSLVHTPNHGLLTLNGVQLVSGQTLTQQDIQQNKLVYHHDDTKIPTDSFSFTASDGVGGSMLETNFALNITPVNHNPVLVTGVLTLDEGGQATLGSGQLAATDLEQGAAALNYALDQVPIHGQLMMNGAALGVGGGFTQADINAGHVAYRHDGGNTVHDLLRFHVTDGQGGSVATTTLAINVNPSNNAPVWSLPNPVTLSENQNVTITGVTLADADLFGNPIKVTSSVSHGILTLPATLGLTTVSGANGSASWTFSGSLAQVNAALSQITYQAATWYHGTDQLVLVANDGGATGLGGAKETVGGVAIAVQPVETAPIAGMDSFTTQQNTQKSMSVVSDLLANDHDPAGLSFSLQNFSQPTHGFLTLAGATLTYTPEINYKGIDQFHYTIVNANGNQATTSVSIVVTPVQGHLLPGDDQVDVLENGSVTTHNLLANDLDPAYLPDGHNPDLAIIGTSAATHGSVTWLGDGRFTYVPNAGFHGVDHFSYSLSVGDQRVDTAQVVVTVHPVNNNPTLAVNTGLTLDEGGQVVVSNRMLQAKDLDQPTSQVHFILASVPAHGLLTLNGSPLAAGGFFSQDDIDNHRVVYTHDNGPSLSDPFTVTLSDGAGGLLSNQMISVSITPVNQPLHLVVDTPITVTPVVQAPTLLSPSRLVTRENVAILVPGLSVADPDVGSKTIRVRLAVGHGLLSVPELPGLQFQDGRNQTPSTTLVGTVTTINQALAGLQYQGFENFSGSDTLNVLVGDQGHAGQLAELTTGISIPIEVTFVSQPPLPGVDAIVSPPNHPFVVNQPVTIDIRTLLGNDYNVNNPRSGLSIHSFTQPQFGTLVDRGNDQWVYVPNDQYQGYDRFTYTVNDSSGKFPFTSVVIINPIEHALQAGNDTLVLYENEPARTANVLLNDSDPSALGGIQSQLTIIAFTQGQHGTVAYTGENIFLYVPDPDYYGSDQFTYTLNAGDRRIDVATVAVTIKPANDQPQIAINAGLGLIQGGTATIGKENLRVTDKDNVDRELIYSLDTIPGQGELVLSGTVLAKGGHFTQEDIAQGRLLYRNTNGASSSDGFRFHVDDSAGGFVVTTDFIIRLEPKPIAKSVPPVVEIVPPVSLQSPDLGRFFKPSSTVSSQFLPLEIAEKPWSQELGQRPVEVVSSPAPSGSVALLGMDVEVTNTPILTVIRSHERTVALEASTNPILTAVMNASPGVEEGGVVTPVLNAVKRGGHNFAPGASITPVMAAVVASRPEGTPTQLGSPFPDRGPEKGFFAPGLSFMPWFPEKNVEPGPANINEGGNTENSPIRSRPAGDDYLVPVEQGEWEKEHPVPNPVPKAIPRQQARLELSEQLHQMAHRREQKAEQFRRAFI